MRQSQEEEVIQEEGRQEEQETAEIKERHNYRAWRSDPTADSIFFEKSTISEAQDMHVRE